MSSSFNAIDDAFYEPEQRSLAAVERQLLTLWSFRLYHKCIMISSYKPGLRWVTPAPLMSSGNVLVHMQHCWGGQSCMCNLNPIEDKTCWSPETCCLCRSCGTYHNVKGEHELSNPAGSFLGIELEGQRQEQMLNKAWSPGTDR